MTPYYLAVVSLTMEWAHRVHSSQPDPPIDLHAACGQLGIRLWSRELPHHIEGFRFRTESGTPYIVVNSSVHRPVGRKRFSIAHEIAHVRLAELLALGAIAVRDTVSDRQRTEWICDHFAGCLLMPEKLFRALWRDYAHKEYGRLAVIANRFEVSTTAVKLRAAHLGLT